MKTAKIVIKVPMPDDATQKDAQALADLIKTLSLTTRPYNGILPTTFLLSPKVFGRITKVTLK